MIVLQDTVEINTSPGQIFAWLAHLPQNYLAWHPDHVACRYLRGGALQEGSILYCEEYLHGALHKLKLRVMKVVPDSQIVYRMFPGLGGAFFVEAHGSHARFTADIYLGFVLPLLGATVDGLVRALFRDRIAALQQHMVQEGQNLKRLIEEGGH